MGHSLPIPLSACALFRRWAPVLRIYPNQMEPTVGFEPTTYGLRNRCSTTELRRHWMALYREYLEHRPAQLRLGFRMLIQSPLTTKGGTPPAGT